MHKYRTERASCGELDSNAAVSSERAPVELIRESGFAETMPKALRCETP